MARLARVLRPAVAGLAAAVLAGGCATVPTVGAVKPVTGASRPVQQFVQPIPPAPQSAWANPQNTVLGFLAASASFADNHAAARRFLAPPLRKTWRPSWAVTLVGPVGGLTTARVGSANLEGESTVIDTVHLTGQQLATISDIGQYLYKPGSQVYPFQLAKFGGHWLIISLPHASSVLLTETAFEQVYQPRNLYFWSQAGQDLVPEPVFAPQQDTLVHVASNLVDALLKTDEDQSSWLTPATMTAFPAGTRLIGQVAIAGSSAIVNLGGSVSNAGPLRLQRMAAQLVMTLTGRSYGQSPISQSVVLEINGRPQDIGSGQLQQPAAYQYLVPGSRPGPATLYFIGADGAVSSLTGRSQAKMVRGPASRAQVPLATIAVSPAGPPQLAGTLAGGQGCVVYYGALSGSGLLAHRDLPDPSDGPCTSLSWDSQQDIWAATAHRLWVLPPGARTPAAVALPPLPGGSTAPYRVLSVRVALDGIRVAMLVQTRAGTRELLLTAITRSGRQLSLGPATVRIGAQLARATALSWYDPDDLIVLAGAQLYEVPANGGAPVAVGGPVPPGTQSVTAAGPGQIAVAAAHGEILTSSGPDQIQQPAVKGTSPVYPG